MSNYYEGRGSFRAAQIEEDVDPMSSLGNIGDIMLVFACGLMVALVLAWNVDLAQFQEVDLGEEMDEPETIEQVIEGGGSTYVEAGTVYMDAETGKYYLVEPTSGGGSGAGGAAAEDDWSDDIDYDADLGGDVDIDWDEAALEDMDAAV